MRRVLIIVLVLAICCGFCACAQTSTGNESNSGTNTSMTDPESAAVEIAIENWINKNAYMLLYEDFKFTISSTEINNNITAKDEEGNVYQYYNVYGKVGFYDKYGELKRSAKFTVVYAYDGSSLYVSDEKTVIE